MKALAIVIALLAMSIGIIGSSGQVSSSGSSGPASSFGAIGSLGPDSSFGSSGPQDSLAKRLREAWTAAADAMVKLQVEDGSWKAGPPGKEQASLAYTGLVTAALAGAPDDVKAPYKDAIARACRFIAAKQNSDGSFGEGPTGAFLKTYATGLCMMALGGADRDKHRDALGNARGYLKANQLKEGPDRGGLGYGDLDPKPEGIKKMEANLSTLGFAAEGMKAAGLNADDKEFWAMCAEYVKKCQNNSEVNTDKEFLARLKEKGLSVGDDGGLYYSANPDKQQSEKIKMGDKETIASYGAMTYDGIKTYLYAGLGKDSPEVKAAVNWVRKNYTVDVHPGFPTDDKKRELQGIFYYYLMMVRALDAFGESPFQTMDGKKHDWASEVAEKLLKIRKENKLWVNDNPRWWENDPVLVTMYVLNTANVLMKHVK